jgi:hypothetical protein
MAAQIDSASGSASTTEQLLPTIVSRWASELATSGFPRAAAQRRAGALK